MDSIDSVIPQRKISLMSVQDTLVTSRYSWIRPENRREVKHLYFLSIELCFKYISDKNKSAVKFNLTNKYKNITNTYRFGPMYVCPFKHPHQWDRGL